MSLCLQYGGIREERAIVGDRKGSHYVLGVTGGWRVNGGAKGVNREAHEVEVPSRGADCVLAGHTVMEQVVQLILWSFMCVWRVTRCPWGWGVPCVVMI